VQNIVFRVTVDGKSATDVFDKIASSAKKAEDIVDRFGNKIGTTIPKQAEKAKQSVEKSTGAMGKSFDKLKGLIGAAFSVYSIKQFINAIETVAKATDKTGNQWEEMVGGMKNVWNDFLKLLSGADIDLSKSFRSGVEAARMINDLEDDRLSSNVVLRDLAGQQLKIIQEIRGQHELDEEGNEKKLLTQTEINEKLKQAIEIQKKIGK